MLVSQQLSSTNRIARRSNSLQESKELVEKAREKDCSRMHTIEEEKE